MFAECATRSAVLQPANSRWYRYDSCFSTAEVVCPLEEYRISSTIIYTAPVKMANMSCDLRGHRDGPYLPFSFYDHYHYYLSLLFDPNDPAILASELVVDDSETYNFLFTSVVAMNCPLPWEQTEQAAVMSFVRNEHYREIRNRRLFETAEHSLGKQLRCHFLLQPLPPSRPREIFLRYAARFPSSLRRNFLVIFFEKVVKGHGKRAI